MPLKDIEPSMAERAVRNEIKERPICPWCGGPKGFEVICWKCYNAEWKMRHADSNRSILDQS